MDFKAEVPENVVNIKVIGIGGAGNNVVNRMVKAGTQGVEFIAIYTDKQALSVSNADQKLQIGEKMTKGQGAGSDPEIGKRSAEESRNNIAKVLENADMAFITCGMGGGTGTGAAPIVAEIARDAGLLTVGVVTKPFKFEGKRRMDQANAGIKELLGRVDSLLIIPNDRLKFATDQKVTLANAFEIADDVLLQAVTSISDLIKNTGFINLDFADVTCIMKNAGFAHMGVGRAAGKGKAEEAARMAVASPLMETSINGARGVLINITGSADMDLEDVETAASLVQEAAHPEANIIFGATFDDTLEDEIRVTVIATGFEDATLNDEAIPVAQPAAAAANTQAFTPVRPAANRERPQGLFTGAAEKAAAAQPAAASAAPTAPAAQPAAGAKPANGEEDPFDSIFKIFNTSK
jgi:cell division protein FtsZ